MAKIIAIANQKGGVGKTTTTINVGAALGELGERVLLIDIDPQGNTTSGLGVEKETLLHTAYELLLEDETVKDCALELKDFHLSLVPSSLDLAGAEVELVGNSDREALLYRKLSEAKDDYDYILIDCPPSLNVLTINAFRAADSILVPIQCEFYAMEGLTQLINTINLVRQRLNPNIQIEGIVFTMYDSRLNLSDQVVEEVTRFMPGKVYKTKIPRNVRLAEAPSYGMPVTQYDPASKGAAAYLSLAEEILERGGKA